ncbi:MAG: GAF domain-containing protein [Verrucomicrobiota bacterium]|nr:GAF domain-containing protein [Verrucomicrobiota bacterium]
MRPTFEKDSEQTLKFHGALVELAKLNHSTLDAALEGITQIAARTLGIARASVWIFNENRTGIDCNVLFQIGRGHERKKVHLRASDFPRYFAALERNRVIAASDAHHHPDTSEFSESYLAPLGINSMLDVPIWRHGKTIGVLCHEHVGPVHEWTHEEKDFAASVADTISLSYEAIDQAAR